MIYRKYLLSRLSLFAADFVFYTIFHFWYVCSRLFLFSFLLAVCFMKFVRETLCKFLYVYASLICIFMQSIMINRNVLEFLQVFRTFAETFYLFTFSFLGFSLILDYLQKTETERKIRFLPFFAAICPFLSQIKR